MGSLVAAGILSGAGKAGTAALAMGQNYLQTSALLAERERLEDARAARNLAAQQGMHRETLAASASEHALDRASIESRSAKEIVSREKEGLLGRESSEKIHGLDDKSREKIAREGNATHKEIAVASNAMHLKIAELQNKLQHQQLKATELTAVQHYIDSLGDDIRGVELKLLDPLADPTSAIGKTLLEDLKMKKTQLARAQAQFDARVSDMQMKDKVPAPKSVAPVEKKPFNPGNYGTVPGPTRTPGIIQMPAPSLEEQEMMRKAIQ